MPTFFLCVIQLTRVIAAIFLRIKSMKELVRYVFVAVHFQHLSLMAMLMRVIVSFFLLCVVSMIYISSSNLNLEIKYKIKDVNGTILFYSLASLQFFAYYAGQCYTYTSPRLNGFRMCKCILDLSAIT